MLSKLSDALLDIQYINTPHNRHITIVDGNVSLTLLFYISCKFGYNTVDILILYK